MYIARRAALLAAGIAVPLFCAAVWFGCANGAASTGTKLKDAGTGHGDGGTGTGTGTGDDGGGGDDSAADSGLSCGETSTNSCASATDLGTIALSDTKSVIGAIDSTGGDAWYKLTFLNVDNTSAHPHVKLTSSDPGFQLEVLSACGGTQLTCGDEDASAAADVKEWEMQYRADPDASIDGTANEADPLGDGGVFIPITVGASGTVYVHVSRPSAPMACDFTLSITN